MSQIFYSVEFDPSYNGIGSYSGVGNFLLVPNILVQQLTLPVAFKQITGHDPKNIVNFKTVYMDEDSGTLSPLEDPEIVSETLTVDPVIYEEITELPEYEEKEEEDPLFELSPDVEDEENN